MNFHPANWRAKSQRIKMINRTVKKIWFVDVKTDYEL